MAISNPELLTVGFERSIPMGQYNQKKAWAIASYVPGSNEAETNENMQEALLAASQAVLSQLGIEYDVKDGKAVENVAATAEAKVIQAFPGASEAPRKTFAKRSTAAGGSTKPKSTDEEVSEFISSYVGDNAFYLKLQNSLKQFGSLTERQAAAVRKDLDKVDA